MKLVSDFHPRLVLSRLCRGLFRAVSRIFAKGISLNIATFSARLRLIYGIFRIFALEFINNCNYDSTDSFNRRCFHA
jgi:hypothetical protein